MPAGHQRERQRVVPASARPRAPKQVDRVHRATQGKLLHTHSRPQQKTRAKSVPYHTLVGFVNVCVHRVCFC